MTKNLEDQNPRETGGGAAHAPDAHQNKNADAERQHDKTGLRDEPAGRFIRQEGGRSRPLNQHKHCNINEAERRQSAHDPARRRRHVPRAVKCFSDEQRQRGKDRKYVADELRMRAAEKEKRIKIDQTTS